MRNVPITALTSAGNAVDPFTVLEPVVRAVILDARPIAKVLAHAFRKTQHDGFAAHAVELQGVDHIHRDVLDFAHLESSGGNHAGWIFILPREIHMQEYAAWREDA